MKTLILLLSVLFTTMIFAQVPNYVPTNGLVGWWPFNGNANDESGNGNNGTVNGATLTADRNGVANQAYSFDGNDLIQITNWDEVIGNSPFSINFWVKSQPYIGWIIAFGISQNGQGFSCGNYHWGSNQFGAQIWRYDYISGTQTNLPDNGWNLMSITYVSNTLKTYKNGSIVHTQNVNYVAPNISTGVLNFGQQLDFSEFFNGDLDDIGFWNRALTDCEIQNLYTSTNPSNTTTASACGSYAWNGTTYTSSGVYTGTTTNCVTESLNLTITPSSTNTTTASACDSYLWNGTTYTASGVYTEPTANCVTESLNLTITPSSTNTISASACDSYTWNGTSYSASGTYTETTSNCVTESLNLTITPSSTNTTPISACNSLTWNGQTYTQSGVYTGTTANCVTQALNLTINTNTSSSISQTALDSYTWPVNNQTYTTTGAYTAVIPNAAGCDSTITLNLTMSFTGINELSASKLIVFPNPTNGDFTITGLELLGSVSSLTLTDMNGKVVKVLDTKATKFSMGSIKPGVYFLNIISENKQEVLKIVKE